MTKGHKCKDNESNEHCESTGKNCLPVGTLAEDSQDGQGGTDHRDDRQRKYSSVH
jgi:hypothetical protein